MAFSFLPYTAEWSPAVREFNARLAAGGAEMRFPETPLAGTVGFLAVNNGIVRGGYLLRHQVFSLDGKPHPAAHYRLPLSEGIVDKAYAMLGGLLLRHALEQQPMLYALGMGGIDRPLPRMLKAAGWTVHPVPFRFRAIHPHAFLRNIRPLRRTAGRAFALDAAAWTGAGSAGLRTLHFVRTRTRGRNLSVEPFGAWGAWADRLWEETAPAFSLAAVRDAATMQALYPPDERRFIRLRVLRSGTLVGWVVLLDTAMRDHLQFGNMRVGTIVDCLAAPQDAAAVMQIATRELSARGVDLVISNQMHEAWSAALDASGFLAAPSNFIFAASPDLAVTALARVHMNRGDGDGPIHL
jgi:hypothetical protein